MTKRNDEMPVPVHRLKSQEEQIPSFPVRDAARRSSLLPSLLLGVVTLIAVAWIVWPGKFQPASQLPGSELASSAGGSPAGVEVHLLKPTYTVSPSPTSTTTPTVIPTLTPVPTSMPVQDIDSSAGVTSQSVYVVQPGDTLFKISQRLNVDIYALTTANNISDPAALYIGQQLVIPQPGSIPVAPSAAGQGSDKRIIIDISEQHMYVYEGDNLAFSFVASTGMNNATRAGTFSVLDKIPNAYGSTWDIWMPYWLGIYWSGNLQNGIHALPILPGGAVLWEGYLGSPISYGCIVLSTYDASVLYDWAEIGTTVEIRW